MKVLEKSGRYQVEDWSMEWDTETYPNLKSMQYVVGCYMPNNHMTCPHTSRVRLSIDFETLEEANECYKHLVNGTKTVRDYAERVYQQKALEWIV